MLAQGYSSSKKKKLNYNTYLSHGPVNLDNSFTLKILSIRNIWHYLELQHCLIELLLYNASKITFCLSIRLLSLSLYSYFYI